ncbi:uncharacterized protein GGS22DRAFT_105917 [Annulohypoxylon maeteangense]|uniref:uncharacterized protein n=1 Tax=Annulohypoxylon maeteangense TaxID=1927788 RepID=UPI002007EE8B|nr:uncharacterized protein GGS22DRAFT_105917 [Annulohypoxylon maeteangense]KAI0887187.1 hypothetical protein GGS22DRAFT_105917 [Annulohypoxylon maeteangense]
MAYRVSSSQADLDSGQNALTSDAESFFDFINASAPNRPSFADAWGPPFDPLNFNQLDLNPQHYHNPQLPSLPGLHPGQLGSPDPVYQHQQQLPSISEYFNPSTHGDNAYRDHDRFGWVPVRPDSAFSGLDPASRRPTPVNYSQHYSVAPPRHEQSRSSSTAAQNTHTHLPQPNRLVPEPAADDYYLFTLANGEFSSPSLPPINSSPRMPTRPQSSNLPKPLEIGEAMPIQPRDQIVSKRRLVDLTKEEPDSTSGIDPTTPTMPPARKRSHPNDARTAAPKRRRSSASSPASSRVNRTKPKRISDVSPFIDDDLPNFPAGEDVHETIDLSNAADVPDDLLADKCDNRMKIGKFQCVICMDDASHLTVTHCGHLFCSECLHSALHIDNMKKTCPVCRTKVDPKEKKGKNQKSYYHLELKIMTANKKGKQPAGSS